MNVIPQAFKDGFVRVVGPVARALIRGGLTPNMVTTLGTLVVLLSAAAFWRGLTHWAGALLLASGLFDILDGQVARQGGMMTTFGAFYDSTLDRVGESAIFGGLALWFLGGGVPGPRVPLAVGLSIAALASSLLVSYTRARAEALGLEAKVGIAQRAERFLVLGVPTLFFGAGRDGALLFWIVVVLAVVTTITVLQRVVHVARTTRARAAAPVRRDTLPGRAPLRKGT
jgi:CDP-diacylglycerol--glycerol-3-phosphate 3-phosphatidyltransferase